MFTVVPIYNQAHGFMKLDSDIAGKLLKKAFAGPGLPERDRQTLINRGICKTTQSSLSRGSFTPYTAVILRYAGPEPSGGMTNFGLYEDLSSRKYGLFSNKLRCLWQVLPRFDRFGNPIDKASMKTWIGGESVVTDGVSLHLLRAQPFVVRVEASGDGTVRWPANMTRFS